MPAAPTALAVPASFAARPLHGGDALAAARLVAELDRAQLEEVTDSLSESDVADWWQRYELERESLGVFASDGALAAFALASDAEADVLELDGYVHPRYVGREIGGCLLAWGESCARARGRLRLRTMAFARDAAAASLLGSRGFAPVRHFYRMIVDLTAEPARPRWPDGVTVSTLAAGEERVLHTATEEAFAGHWGRPQRSFEEWERSVFAATWFDSSLVFLARAASDVVAAEVAAHRFGIGWIATLGVRPGWRRQGLGRALLLHAFGELYRRGERRIGLAVDAGNETGAPRLYESVGMRVAWQATAYERAL